jgi:tRNA pseudouridine38-40 synthase
VPPGFHARFHARGKRYLYRFLVDPVRPAVGRGYYHWVRRRLDVAAMRAAAALLRGRHDVASFANNPGYERKHGTVRTMRHLHLRQRGRMLDFWVQGDGFLYNMVRAFAGTLLDVGLGRYGPLHVAEILAARDRRVAGATAPAHALYLVRVLYADDLFAGDACETGVDALPSDPPAEVE